MSVRIAIALSGGIDSLVSAFMLKRAGHDVAGIHFVTGYEPHPEPVSSQKPMDALSAARDRMAPIQTQLGIPIEIIDCSEAFQSTVVDYFSQTYLAGRTPNPCLVCNPGIKFGFILNQARTRGHAKLATGHYARIETDADGRPHLLRGVDRDKDQSYFLAFLTPEQLQQAEFPLGQQSKTETRSFAAQHGLTPIHKTESQDICFVPQGGYEAFLMSQKGFHAPPGPIVTLDGETIGRHAGLHRYTIGQRRGIGCPAPSPYYVVSIDAARNRLVVGSKSDLYQTACRVTGVNWIQPPQSTYLTVLTKLRYRHPPVEARLTVLGDGQSVGLTFKEPQAAVTPGQGAVFYLGQEVIGGGFIHAQS